MRIFAMSLWVKICGINDEVCARALVGSSAMGFMFYPRSPRFVTAPEASHLARFVPKDVAKIGVFVDSNDDVIEHILEHVTLDGIQLHGTENNARILAVKKRFNLPIIKGCLVTHKKDIDEAAHLYAAADRILFDGRSALRSEESDGHQFEWRWLKDSSSLPACWCLAGGIDKDNLRIAVMQSGARAVDVSSCLESEKGKKSPDKIKQFLQEASCL